MRKTCANSYNIINNNGKFWFWNLWENSLYWMDEMYNAHMVPSLCCYSKRSGNVSLYGKLESYGKIIIGVPMGADEILIFDTELGEDRYCPLPNDIFCELNAERGKFWDILIVDRFAYLIGYWSSKIVKFDLEKERVADILDLYGKVGTITDDIYFKKSEIMGNKIIVPLCQSNEILLVDKESLAVEKRVFKETEDGFSSVHLYEDIVWLIPRKTGKIISWNTILNEVRYYESPEKLVTLKPSYGFAEKIGSTIWIFPLVAQCVLRIDTTHGKIEIDEKLTSICCNESVNQKIGYVTKENENLIIHRWIDSSIIIYNVKTEDSSMHYINCIDNNKQLFIKEMCEKREIINEGFFSIEDLIGYCDSFGKEG